MDATDKQLKSYLAIFVIVAIFPIFFFGFLGFVIEPLSGDLTRLGRLSERDFGWNAPQPEIDIRALNRNNKPDVVVLGDSFSEPNVWQTVAMEKTKLSLLTFIFPRGRQTICLDHWMVSILSQYPSAKTIVIETTEKNFLHRFKIDVSKCKRQFMAPFPVAAKRTSGQRPSGLKYIMPDPVYAIRAVISMTKNFATPTISGGTIVVPLNRTDLFSNRRSELLLYYEEDDHKKLWQQREIETAIATISSLKELAATNRIDLIVNIVPDKSSVYSRFLQVPRTASKLGNIQQAMLARGIKTIDLLAPFNETVTSFKDLYLPNDTHLSTRGYVLMGETIAKELPNKDTHH
jgi:hypothetical protein